MADVNLKSWFGEILAGYSILTGNIFYKHYNYLELGIMDTQYPIFLEDAKKRGIPTEEERKKFLIKTGQWSLANEQRLKDSKEMLTSLENVRRQAFLESQIQTIKQNIRREEALYSSLYSEKYRLIGLTVESCANKKLNEFYVKNSLFYDINFSQKMSDKEWDKLSDIEYDNIINKHNETVNNLLKNLKKIALADFAQSLWSLSNDSAYEFYGKPVTQLSTYQVDLCRWIKIFESILSKHTSVPSRLYEEPEELLDWVNSGKNLEEVANKAGEGKNTTVIGAKRKDMEKINKSDINQASSFIDKLKQSGKTTMNINDLVS